MDPAAGPTAATVKAAELRRFATEVLRAVGATDEVAQQVADGLVFANLRGVDTHGVMRLPIYARRIAEGVVNGRPRMRLERTGTATAVLDGDNGPGIAVGVSAVDEAIAIGRDAGAGVVVVRGSNHFGAAAFPALRAVEMGMVGIAATHAEADVVPFGGARPALGTNPIAIAVPGGAEPPLVLDMATSVTAIGRVMLAAAEGQPIPPGWAVDESGAPTTDARRARAVLPLGGPKGYGLAVMIDVLCGLLSGGPVGTLIPRMYDDFSKPQSLGHFIVALDVARFVDPELFRQGVDMMTEQLRNVPPATGTTRVMLPGEPERLLARERAKNGVPLGPRVTAELEELARRLGLAVPIFATGN